MKILVATDAWHPQVNGVVRTLGHVAARRVHSALELEFLSPDQFRTLPMPSYPEIRLALAASPVRLRAGSRKVGRMQSM